MQGILGTPIFVFSKRQPPALSRETNTDVTRTAIHRLATRGGLNPIDPPC